MPACRRATGSCSAYNILARQPGRTNGGQQINCRVNALANAVLSAGGAIELWYRVTAPVDAARAEAERMMQFGVPPWNRRTEGLSVVVSDNPPIP